MRFTDEEMDCIVSDFDFLYEFMGCDCGGFFGSEVDGMSDWGATFWGDTKDPDEKKEEFIRILCMSPFWNARKAQLEKLGVTQLKLIYTIALTTNPMREMLQEHLSKTTHEELYARWAADHS